MLNREFILRLLRYKDVLNKLKSLGFVKVFADNLVDAAGVSSSQVRKDFSLLRIMGNKRGGYRIDDLIEELNVVLGKKELNKVIIVGCGKIGMALMKYNYFEKEGIKIVAGFDVDPEKLTKEGEIPILPLENLKGYIKDNNIKVGIITVSETAAAQTLEAMINAGIKGVLNFAPIRLKTESSCIINNVNIAHEIENIIYFVNATEKTKKSAKA